MAKFAMDDDGTTLTIRIGSFQWSNLPVIIFLIVWLGGWTMGEVFALTTLFGGDTPWFVNGFLLFWLVMWTIGGGFAMLSLLKLIGGSERIEIGRGLLKISRSFILFSRSRQFDVFRITGLRLDPQKQNRLNPFNNGAFRFDYDMKEIRFGAGLSDADKKQVWNRILQQGEIKERNLLQ